LTIIPLTIKLTIATYRNEVKWIEPNPEELDWKNKKSAVRVSAWRSLTPKTGHSKKLRNSGW
jgi:hypothetical protein